MERDGDGLAAALDSAALASAAALKLAMLVLVHDATYRLPLSW
jgi:hypothetical protein